MARQGEFVVVIPRRMRVWAFCLDIVLVNLAALFVLLDGVVAHKLISTAVGASLLGI